MVGTLTEKLDACTATTNTLEEGVAAHSIQLLSLEELEEKIKLNGRSVTTTAASIATLAESQANSEDGINYALSELGKKVDGLTTDAENKTQTPTCAAIGGNVDENLAVHASVLNTDHVVGFYLHVLCKDGYAPEGNNELTCFPSGKFCTSDGFPSGGCDTGDKIATCKKCPTGCTTCLPNGGGCTSCVDGQFIANKVCATVSNCAGYAKAGILKQGVTKYTDLDLPILLSTDGEVELQKTSTKSGACMLDDEDNVYEVIPCTFFFLVEICTR
jgi:hypothetical protein